MSSSNIERTNLDAHVSICELRYQSLNHRLDQLERRLDSVDTLLSEIRDTLSQQPVQQNLKWDRFQWYLIGVLGSAVGWFATHQILR
jgi:chromosome segregation ATPase